MRNTVLVAYDIRDEKRPRKVFKTMRDFGDHLEYSVFECQFAPSTSPIAAMSSPRSCTTTTTRPFSSTSGPPDDAANASSPPSPHRNRTPPRDPVNARLSLAYSVLDKDLTVVCHAVGLDPFVGLLHQPRFGRAPLPLDLMEPFRPLVADSAVLSAIKTRMVTPRDLIRAGQSVARRPDGRKAFFRAYEQRMHTLATHPLFGYRLNYRRMLEIQTRLLARTVTGEIKTYTVLVPR
jgi:hypothetical protein